MKILKSIFVLILFSNLVSSCTVDDISEGTETNLIESNIQATGENDGIVDETKKD